MAKYTTDGAGRLVASYTTDGGGDSGYADADDVTGDIVLEQATFTHDASGNVLTATTRQRFHDASGTGALGSPSSGIGARVSYAGFYYDLADRPTASVDVGTNGGSAWTRPGSVPSSSATAHVTLTRYATDAVQAVALTGNPTGGTFTLSFGGHTTSAIAYNASAATIDSALEALTSIGSGNVAVVAAPGGNGWDVRFTGTLADSYQTALTASGAGLTGGTSPGVSIATVNAGGDAGMAAETVDPAGREHRQYADALGRTVRGIEHFVDGVVSDGDDKTVGYTFNGAGMTSLAAYLTGGGAQETRWLYNTLTQTAGSAIDTKDMVGVTQWPDETLGLASSSQQETVTVNALGQTLTTTDRNGSVHTFTYDVLGRVVSDAVTTLGSGVDGAVRRIEFAYDGRGNAYKVTSFDAASGGNVVSEVLREFNGLGQLTAEYQSHSGAVNTSTSPKVQYAWSEMPSGANHSRLTSVTYPDGYVLTHNYSSGLNSSISRLSSLSDSTGTLEAYEYLGLGGVVVRSHPQPDLDLSYAKRSGESNGDAGDQYTGLDRFGRVVDQRWLDASSGVATDRFQYGHDILGNRLYRDNLVNTAFGELYGYDAMTQLVSFDRGTLDGPKTGLTGAASRAQDWDYDAVGNFDSVTTNGTAQARTANRQNEITSIGGQTTPTYDANGNMTGDETGKQFVYDGWNRLTAVKSSGGTTLKTYSYDGLNRRVAETAGGTTTDLFYSADWQVLAEKVGSNTTQRYVWSPVYVDAMVLRDRDTNADGTLDERLWVQQDANFNVTALVDGSGTVVERCVYDAFGVVTVLDGSFGSRGTSSYGWDVLWQGMRYDDVSGSYKSRYRTDISPTLGRPFQLDPLGLGPDVNPYRWEANGPTNYTDPSGLDKGLSPEDLAKLNKGAAGGNGAEFRQKAGLNDPIPAPRANPPAKTPPRFEYFETAGWIDWTHAQAEEAKFILDAILNEKSTTRCGCTDQAFTIRGKVGHARGDFVVKKGMSKDEKIQVAFSIYFALAYTNETMQTAAGPLRHLGVAGSTSGFSQEDLTSNLLGFHMALTGMSRDDVTKALGNKLTPEQTQKLLKEHGGDLGLIKNKTLVPIDHNATVNTLFPGLNWAKTMKPNEIFGLYKATASDKWSPFSCPQ